MASSSALPRALNKPAQVHVVGRKFDVLLEETKKHKEQWLWDKIIPAKDITLIAAFMKKGKTTLLTGLVNGLIRTGTFCMRDVKNGRKVLYLAPEEGHTLIRRFAQLGFSGSEPALTIIPRADPLWNNLITWYRMRMWNQVVLDLKRQGYDTIVMDGLHTMLSMFEVNAKDDNDTVTQFMANFVLPFGNDFTVIAALHTKKTGGDPRINTPPEESIRGASAWLAQAGQIIVFDHDRKADVKNLKIFGRYEQTDEGVSIRYSKEAKNYLAITEEEVIKEQDAAAQIKKDIEKKQVEALVMALIANESLTVNELKGKVTKRKTLVQEVVDELIANGDVETEETKGTTGQKKVVLKVAKKAMPQNAPKLEDVDFDKLEQLDLDGSEVYTEGASHEES